MEDKTNAVENKIHICDLANQEKNDEIKELARDPQFMCFSCGRVANAKDDLCNPLAFYELTGGVSFD